MLANAASAINTTAIVDRGIRTAAWTKKRKIWVLLQREAEGLANFTSTPQLRVSNVRRLAPFIYLYAIEEYRDLRVSDRVAFLLVQSTPAWIWSAV